jgi:hypothetical protein
MPFLPLSSSSSSASSYSSFSSASIAASISSFLICLFPATDGTSLFSKVHLTEMFGY